jgi:hypothetical protein
MMYAAFSFCIWGTVVTQVLAAIAHSIGFFVPFKPGNESEKQLTDLSKNYKINMGAGFRRSYDQLFIGVSICFTIFYLFGAVLNWYFLRAQAPRATWKGLILIEMIFYGLVFLFQLRFTFLPPIIVTGIVFLFLAATYFLAM